MSAARIEWRAGTTTGAEYESIPCIYGYINGKCLGYYLPCNSSVYASHQYASFRDSLDMLPHARSTWYEKDIEAHIQEDIDKLYQLLSPRDSNE